MRKVFSLAMVAGLLGLVGAAGEASAVPSVTLYWQGAAPQYAGETGTLDVVLSSDVTLDVNATFMVGIVDTSATAPKITAATNTPPARFHAVAFAITPDAPNGTTVGAFGGLIPFALPAGVYTLGTLNVTLGSAGGNGFVIQPFQRPGIDDWYDESAVNVIVPQLNSITTIPEPGTAALLGLGLAGLVAVCRRSRA